MRFGPPFPAIAFAVGIVFVLLCVREALAQAGATAEASQTVVLVKLSPLVYPPLARQAQISGEVKIQLAIRRDGHVESAVAMSGHAMLKQAALESAQKSQFECRECGEGGTAYWLTFAFELRGDKDCCTAISRPPDITRSLDRITISAPKACLCETTTAITKIKVRSLKCAYLWKCGSRVVKYE